MKLSIRFFILLFFVGIGSANSADILQKQALEIAAKELDKHIVRCGSAWYGYGGSGGWWYFEMKRREGPKLEVKKPSEADKLNGVEFEGWIKNYFTPHRKGDYSKQKNRFQWLAWENYGLDFGVYVKKQNGQWTTNAPTIGGPAWSSLNYWFKSCGNLSAVINNIPIIDAPVE